MKEQKHAALIIRPHRFNTFDYVSAAVECFLHNNHNANIK